MTTGAVLDVRGAVAAAACDLAGAGLLIGTAGNVSMRDGDHVGVTATGVVLGVATAADVTIVDLDGNVVTGGLAPTSELDLHLGVYRRYGAAAVVHTHAPRATAVGCALDELPVIHYQQLALGGAIRVAPFHAFGTTELAHAVLDALEHRSAALMANHGAVTFGASLDAAVQNALLLEWCCELYANTVALGTPRVLSPAQQAAVIEAALHRGYGTTRPVEKETR